MSRIVSISPPGGGASPTFEQPYEMLAACHERVQRMLALLGRLRDHLRRHGADDQARGAARDVMRYFDQAAPQHHLDEELHVFPRLDGTGDAALAAVVRRLRDDHLRMESAWAAARSVLAPLAAGERDAIDPEQDRALDDFAGLYDEHIRAEEELVYPAASAGMDEADTRAMGQEMMRRRGVR
ncbi:hemerythrin domain-containing protein [Ramlibacter tataouinensis]|uniref:hemerythrin domain-containing protein n=1 Tax=Ramlibacter tataouinensis TaxID=94132 RepID=UPI0022F3B347|nr:hemerythrin domain-containing protein [Ramlibacter tataouinensis]WBY02521.1 hemerythrin domain-containing protein [Ramlibacter tataouinensis]